MSIYGKIIGLALGIMSAGAAQAGWLGDDCPPPPVSAAGATFETAFGSGKAVADLAVSSIRGATKSIHIAAGGYVSKSVSTALLEALRSGKQVKVILDASQSRSGYSDVAFLVSMHIPAFALSGQEQHASYMIIDDKDVLVGNIADTSEDAVHKGNASLLLIRGASELAAKYEANWQHLATESKEIVPDK